MRIARPFQKTISKLIDAAIFMAFGGLLLAYYAEWQLTPVPPEWRAIRGGLTLLFCSLLIMGNVVRPGDDHHSGASYSEPSPRWSGVWVVVATGGASLYMLHSKVPFTAEAVIVLAIALITATVWRFASLHGNEIGEARFNNTDPE